MKPSFLFLSTVFSTLAIVATLHSLPAMAQTDYEQPVPPPEVSMQQQTPGQPFTRPSDDMSYSQDIQDDRRMDNNASAVNNAAYNQNNAENNAADNGMVRFVSGGVGDEGMEAIDAEEKNYNLKLLFALRGEYVADVNVKIADRRGNDILDTKTNGPVLLVSMPAGRYRVTAQNAGGETLTHDVSVSNNHLSSYVMHYSGESDD